MKADLKNYVEQFLEDYIKGTSKGSINNAIRSQKIIDHIHQYAVDYLKSKNVKNSYIKRNRKCQGFFKVKEQDILITKSDKKICTEPEISINVRSQMSSIQKNFDTLYERLIAESVNLHKQYKYLPCGYIYLIPTLGLDSSALKKGKFKPNESYDLEKYISSFYKITGRKSVKGDDFKYESIGLIIIDIRPNNSFEIINDLKYLNEIGRISDQFVRDFNSKFMRLDPFKTIDTLLEIYGQRNDINEIIQK
ncbi:hypothetical protein [Athalassotoga sp.]|uniref:hypothetical protein n=1 Tax=Athalassotoga sp. TaxID=2022597 RepID=UPI003D0886A0